MIEFIVGAVVSRLIKKNPENAKKIAVGAFSRAFDVVFGVNSSPKISPEIRHQAEQIFANKSLSDAEKEKMLADLYKNRKEQSKHR